MKKRWVIVLVHIAAWFIFLLLPGFFRPHHGPDDVGILGDLFITHRFINAVYLILLFYTNYFIIIPQLYLKRKYVAFGISIITAIAVFCLINYAIINLGMARRGPRTLFAVMGPSHNLLMFLNVYVFSFALRLYAQWRQTAEEKLNTEISFLKAQINPHFLFNTLNSIYSLTLTKSDKAPEAVVKLSAMMRYAISEAEQAYVSLDKEITYISNFIALQKLRLTHKVKLNYNVTGSIEGKRIAPFLLIPFIENAFKHGVNAEENSKIDIQIAVDDTKLKLQVTNLKVYVQHSKEAGTGLGIKNTKQRLELLYPGKHQLTVTDGDDEFSILLEINW